MSGAGSDSYVDVSPSEDVTASERLRRFCEKQHKRPVTPEGEFDVRVGGAKFRKMLDVLEDVRHRNALEEYYQLLDSYTLDKWSRMPWPLSPINCALRGWECFAEGILRCSVCRKSCSFDLFSYYEIFHGLAKTDQNMRAWLIEEFTTKLAGPTHDVTCSRRPLLRASLVNQFANFTMKSFRNFFENRLSSLFALCEKLAVVVAEYDEVVTSKDAFRFLAKYSRVVDATLATNTVAIALHGWEHITREDGLKVLHCRECRRQIDYGKFCTFDRLSVLQQNENANFHPDLFSFSAPEVFRFDCRLEHLSWCPWIRPVSLSEEMCKVLSLKGAETVVGCDVTIAAFSADVAATNGETSGDVSTNFQSEVDSLKKNIAAAKKEMFLQQPQQQ